MPKRQILIPIALITLLLTAASVFSQNTAGKKAGDDFDRLDGKGESGIRVDVIEWAGNMELHMYPKGSTVSLAMKIDRKNKSKPVMVIGYRFKTKPKKQYVRRALLTMPMNDKFYVFEDKTNPNHDKFIVSNHIITGNVARVTLEPGPKQLYPDGHPALAKKEQKKQNPKTQQQRHLLRSPNSVNPPTVP